MVHKDHSTALVLHMYRGKGNYGCKSVVFISNCISYGLVVTFFVGMSAHVHRLR